MMKSKDNKPKKEGLNESVNFFRGLQQRYMSLRTEQSVKQSHVRQVSKSVKTMKNKKNSPKEQKSQTPKVVLDVSQLTVGDQQNLTTQHYNFDAVINASQKLAEIINSMIIIEKPKFISIKVDSLSQQSSGRTKTQIVAPYVQQIIKQFQKAIICIYSMSNSSETREFYDMLSIRREVKTDSKLLVQTNICNNNKSGVILKKLIDVAKERQKIMNEEELIKTVVIKIKGALPIDKQNSHNGESKLVELQISSGGLGQVGNKDLLGADRMRISLNVIQCHSELSSTEVEQKLNLYKKKVKRQSQNQLIEKIKVLQQELLEKKKELESQKERVAREEAIEAELEDIVLPSERPMVNIQKYDTRKVAASRKSSIRSGKHI